MHWINLRFCIKYIHRLFVWWDKASNTHTNDWCRIVTPKRNANMGELLATNQMNSV